MPNPATWLADTFARNKLLHGDLRMEATGGDGGDGDGDGGDGNAAGKGGEGSFTQADLAAAVEKVAAKIRAEERKKAAEKFADYDDLKKKAEGSATVEEQLTALQKELESTKREALKRRVQAAHGIPDEDADLFLTGSDEDTLTAQAKRLADRDTQRKKQGNRVPNEGTTPPAKAGDEREFVRSLFGSGG